MILELLEDNDMFGAWDYYGVKYNMHTSPLHRSFSFHRTRVGAGI